MTAASIDELILYDDPGRWEGFGFAVHDGRCELGGVTVRLAGAGAGTGGFAGWSLRGVASCELDGLPTSASATPVREPAGEHPNGVVAIDHVVAMTPDLERTVAALQAAGLDLRRIREQPTATGLPRQAFFRLGREILEVVQQPQEMLERAGAARQPARFWGLALVAADLERAAAAFGEHAGRVRPAVQEGRQIAPVRRSAGLAVPVALMSGRPRRAAA